MHTYYKCKSFGSTFKYKTDATIPTETISSRLVVSSIPDNTDYQNDSNVCIKYLIRCTFSNSILVSCDYTHYQEYCFNRLYSFCDEYHSYDSKYALSSDLSINCWYW